MHKSREYQKDLEHYKKCVALLRMTESKMVKLRMQHMIGSEYGVRSRVLDYYLLNK